MTKDQTEVSLRVPASSIRHRKEFHLANKDVDESMENWYNRLRGLAEACEYGSHFDAFLLHQFIIGLDPVILESLYAEERDLSLIDVIELTRNYERNKEQVDVVSVEIIVASLFLERGC